MLEILTQNQFWLAYLCQAAELILFLRCHGLLMAQGIRTRAHLLRSHLFSTRSAPSPGTSTQWSCCPAGCHPLPSTGLRCNNIDVCHAESTWFFLGFFWCFFFIIIYLNSDGQMPAQESKNEMKIKKKKTPFPVLLEHLSLNWYILLKQRCGSSVSAVLCSTVTPALPGREHSPQRAMTT